MSRRDANGNIFYTNYIHPKGANKDCQLCLYQWGLISFPKTNGWGASSRLIFSHHCHCGTELSRKIVTYLWSWSFSPL